MARDEASKSKLINLLQQVSRGTTQRIGLVPTAAARVPAMVLVTVMGNADAQSVGAAVAAGADAVAVAAGDGLADWDGLAKAAGAKPIGIVITGDKAPGAEELKQYIDRGPDFIIAPAGIAPVGLLAATGVGKIVALDQSYQAQMVRALGEMPVDAVLAENGEDAGSGPLTVRDLLHFRQMVDLVRRPVLVMAGQRLSIDALPALRDMGVEGLLLRFPATTQPADVSAQVPSYRTAIDGLGRPIGRGREHGQAPVLPRVAPSPPGMTEPEEEPDEDE